MKIGFYLLLIFCNFSVRAQTPQLEQLMNRIKSYETHTDYNYELHLDLITYYEQKYLHTKDEKWKEKHLFFTNSRLIKKQRTVYITSDFEMNYYLLDEDFEIIKTFNRRISSFRSGVSIAQIYETIPEDELPYNASYQDRTKDYEVLINKKGERINPGEFSNILFLSGGMLKVSIKWKNGICDSTGRLILPVNYGAIEASPDRQTQFIVSDGEKYGIVDRNENLIIPYEYTEIKRLHRGEYFVVAKGEKYGVVDSQNTIVIPFKYGQELTAYNDSVFYSLGEDGYNAFLMNVREDRISPVFSSISRLQYYRKGYSKIVNFGYVGVINTNTCEVIIPAAYDELRMYSSYIWVKKGNYEGIFDYQGNMIIPIEFNDIQYRYTPNQMNVLIKDGKFGMYNRQDQPHIDFIYDDLVLNRLMNVGLFGRGDTTEILNIETSSVLHTFNVSFDGLKHKDILAIDSTGEKGLLAMRPLTGEGPSPFDQYNIVKYYEGYAIFRENGKFGAINYNDELIVPAEYIDFDSYDLITDPSCDIYLKKDDKWYRFNILGESMPLFYGVEH
jgi:hypothetical protein